MNLQYQYKSFCIHLAAVGILLVFLQTESFSQIEQQSGKDLLKVIDSIARQPIEASREFEKLISLGSPGIVTTYSKTKSPYCVFAALVQNEKTTLFIFAPNGEPLFYKTINDFCYDFKLHPNGLLSYFETDIAGFILLDSLFTPVDTIRMPGFQTDYHEFRITEDGGYLLFGLDPRSIDMSNIVEGGDEDATVVGNVIMKLDAQKNPVFEWNSFNHFDILDSYAEKRYSYVDYVHFNAIETDTDSTIILSSRNLSELTRINMRTREIIWRLGGKRNQFAFLNFERIFSGQHAIRRKQENVYTLFDNGLLSNPKYSMGIELIIDEDSMIVEKVREFRHNPDIYSIIRGNLQNLNNGNTLVSWGKNNFTEFDEKTNIVHEGSFINCDLPTYGVNKYVWKNRSFTADRDEIDFGPVSMGDSISEVVVIKNHLNEDLIINEFVLGHSAFSVRKDTITILQGEQVELEVNFMPEQYGNTRDILTIKSNRLDYGIAIQVALSGSGFEGTNISLKEKIHSVKYYPVPFNEYLQYNSDKQIERVELSDINGRVVHSETELGVEGFIDTQIIEAGIYIISTWYTDKTTNHLLINKSANCH